MKAVVFNANIPNYLSTLVLGKLSGRFYFGKMACTSFKEIQEPLLPNENWVKLKTILGGICGSDLNVIYLKDSPSTSPFVSFPFVFGHEAMGEIIETGDNVNDFKKEDRVLINPLLSCDRRGIGPVCDKCKEGKVATCNHFAEGDISPGMLTGFCSDTGGSWGEYFVAHKSQLYKVPDGITNEEIILTDPLASALQPVLANCPEDNEKILVMGAGIIGLLLVASIRALGIKCHITVLAKYQFQGELAKIYGANEVIYTRQDIFSELARISGGKLYKPIIGKKVAMGGFHKIYDCVASNTTLDTALRFAKAGGKLILVGLASIPKTVDWSQIWFRELKIEGSFCYSNVNYKGQLVDTFEEAFKMIVERRVDVKPLITHKFPLSDFKKAVKVASDKKKYKSVKVVFKY